jgi:NADPH:quinone reductase-like Zn-dependent oxidoreductase
MKNERILIAHKGGPEVLKMITEEMEPAGPSEVLVRVRAAGVSFADVLVREGIYPGVKLPATPGYDVVGNVESTGDGAGDLRQGDLVAAMTTRTGGYSRYLRLPTKHAVRVPTGLEPAMAVIMVLNYLTAFQMLKRCAQVFEGDPILVHGAAGGVGTALLQLAGLWKIKAFGTASKGKHPLVEKLGAVPIDYAKEDFVERVRRETNGGVAAVFDFNAGGHAKRSYQALRSTGTLVCYGANDVTQNGRFRPFKAALTLLQQPSFKPIALLDENKGVVGYNSLHWRDARPEAYLADLTALFEMLKEGRITPILGARFPLEKASEAHELLNRSGTSGKIVLDC